MVSLTYMLITCFSGHSDHVQGLHQGYTHHVYHRAVRDSPSDGLGASLNSFIPISPSPHQSPRGEHTISHLDHGNSLLTGLLIAITASVNFYLYKPDQVTLCSKSSVTSHCSWNKGRNPPQGLCPLSVHPHPHPQLCCPSKSSGFLPSQARLFHCREHSPLQLSLEGLLGPYLSF